MAPITLEQFKTGWELGLEVAGSIVGTIALVWRNAGLIKSFYDVCKGRATRKEREAVAQTLRDADPMADRVLDHIVESMNRHGHTERAARIKEVEDEIQAQQA